MDELNEAFLGESYEELYENAPCGYVSTRPDGRIVRVNETFLEWSGYARDALLGGRRFPQLLSVTGRIYHETHVAPLLSMQGSVNEIALELVRADGSRLPILINALQFRDDAGEPKVNRITVFDASERRAYERELLAERRRAEQAAQAKADFLSMVSHEIRTPLGAIMGVAHLLARTDLSAKQAKYLRILRSSSKNLLELVDEILDFSRIEAGKLTLDAASFSLRDLIYETVYRLGVKADERGVALRVDLDEALPPWLVADAGKLGQVLTNLIGNAVKFTHEGSVTVSGRLIARDEERAEVHISVTDTGVGIPADRLDSIFEAFTQASAKVGTRYGGTGLGLAISQGLLALHESRLHVESTLGEGSTFSFTLGLPLGEPVEVMSESGDGAEDARGLRVLVVDDNPVNIFVVSRCLDDWQVDYDVARDGREAVERVKAHDYDVVLMDLQMPVMDGYEATRHIRALPDEKYEQLPIIAVSASTRIGQQDKVDLAGFTGFLGKPYEPNPLLARLVSQGRRGIQRATAAALPAMPEVVPPPTPPFTLDALRRQADDADALRDLFALVGHDLRSTCGALRAALADGDAAAYAFQAHRVRVTVDLLRAHALRAAIARGARLLDEPPVDPRHADAAALGVEWAVGDIDAALLDELKNPRV